MNTRKPIELWQIEGITYANLPDKPTTWGELGLIGPFPFVMTSPQNLSEEEKEQARLNIGLDGVLHDPVTLDTSNGLSLSGQELSLGLATTSSPGAMSQADKQRIAGANVVQGDGMTITVPSGSTLSSRVLGSGSITFGVNQTVLRVSGNQTVTGLKTVRRAGPNNGSSAGVVQQWEIDSSQRYMVRLMNTQNVQAPDGEVQWFFDYKSHVGLGSEDITKTRDMIGFARGAVTIFGGRSLPESQYTTIITDEGNHRMTPGWRYPLMQYSYGMSQFEDGIIVGTDAVKVQDITGDVKAYFAGTIKTASPDGGLESPVSFGSYNNSADSSVTHVVRMRSGDKVFDLLAREV